MASVCLSWDFKILINDNNDENAEFSNRVSGDDKKHRLQIAKNHENGMAQLKEGPDGEGVKGEGRKRWKKSEFVLRVMGIISIDPGSLSYPPDSHPRPSPTISRAAGWLVGSFELVRAKTHGNSSVYGERRVAKCGWLNREISPRRMRE